MVTVLGKNQNSNACAQGLHHRLYPASVSRGRGTDYISYPFEDDFGGVEVLEPSWPGYSFSGKEGGWGQELGLWAGVWEQV